MVVDLTKVAEGTGRVKEYQKIIDRIDLLCQRVKEYKGSALKDLIRPEIDRLDDEFIIALEKRSRYPLLAEFFNRTGRYEGLPQKALEALGIDTI